MRLLSVGLLVLVMGIVGCEALNTVDVPATLQADIAAYAAEATGIPATLSAQSTAVAVTAVYAETYIAQVDGINRQIVATLRAGMPPTPQIVLGADPSTGTLPLDGGGGAGAGAAAGGFTEFTPPQTASAVRGDDGCAEVVTSQFGTADSIIYVTTRAFNMRAGTDMAVEWTYGGQVVYSFNFIVDVDDSDYCLWFSITPEDVAFSPGEWSVRLLANGAPIEPSAAFSIVEGM